MKHEWRKKEKDIYLPKQAPAIIEVPTYQFLTIKGTGNPNSHFFSECIQALYALSYAVKMTLKKENLPSEYTDYTVYPLEGIWDLTEEGKKAYNGTIDKNELVFKLMIRQPDFVEEAFVEEMRALTIEKKSIKLLEEVQFEQITEGKCIQMLHLGSYDNEPETFQEMEAFAKKNNLSRLSKAHREIYLSDFRKVAEDKLKTVLRFQIGKKEE